MNEDLLISLVKIFGSLGLLMSALYGVRVLGGRLGWHAEIQRKTIHTSLGLYALTFPLIFSNAWEVAALCALAIMLLFFIRQNTTLKEQIGGGLHAVERFSYGEIFFAFSIALLFYLSADQAILYILPIAILTLSDAAAALIGVIYARTTFKVEEGTKSWEGTVFFFLTAWLLSMITLLLLTDVDRGEVILIALIIAMFGALIEATSWKGLDNLFVPIGLFLLLRNTLALPVSQLLIDSVIFAGLLVIGMLIARAKARDMHSVCTAITGLFFFWIVGGWANIAAPLVLFGTHIYLSFKNNLKTDDLIVVLSIISTALFWYTTAVISGYEVYYVFNLSLALHLVFLLLLDQKKLSLSYGIFAVLLAWAVSNLHFHFMGHVPDGEILMRSLYALPIILSGALIAVFARNGFENHRWSKQAVLSIIISSLGVPVTLWLT